MENPRESPMKPTEIHRFLPLALGLPSATLLRQAHRKAPLAVPPRPLPELRQKVRLVQELGVQREVAEVSPQKRTNFSDILYIIVVFWDYNMNIHE